jgi:membrane-associated phospholipid phosphatase
MNLTFIKNLKLFKRETPQQGFLAVEKIGLAYNLFTCLLIALLFADMDHPGEMLIERLLILLGTLLFRQAYRLYPSKLTAFIRVAFQLGLLAYWYPDTYEFNRLFPNMDHHFAALEQTLFGCQPSVSFSASCPSLVFSELFNLGYFSYYPMIVGVILSYFLLRHSEFQRAAYLLMASFFLYYLLYIFIPVAGPQYYFPAIGMDHVAAGHFPAVGDYFRHCTDLAPAPNGQGGFFYSLVESSQQAGERPTAAFPSSHVGISTILLILAYRLRKTLFITLLPFYVLLCCATVYIQAHYLIDALAGFVSAFIIYEIALFSYKKLESGR